MSTKANEAQKRIAAVARAFAAGEDGVETMEAIALVAAATIFIGIVTVISNNWKPKANAAKDTAVGIEMP